MKKKDVVDLVKEFPKEIEFELLMEKLVFIDKVEKGLEQAKNGKTV